MNYKLLANINYQVQARFPESGMMRVVANIEHALKFNPELIVQEHAESESHIPVDVSMQVIDTEEFVIVVNGAELEKFRSEEQAYNYIDKKVEAIPQLEGLLEIEVNDIEIYRNPPAHEIRRQILNALFITQDEEAMDRSDDDQIYDGYTAPGCSSDGRPLF